MRYSEKHIVSIIIFYHHLRNPKEKDGIHEIKCSRTASGWWSFVCATDHHPCIFVCVHTAYVRVPYPQHSSNFEKKSIHKSQSNPSTIVIVSVDELYQYYD